MKFLTTCRVMPFMTTTTSLGVVFFFFTSWCFSLVSGFGITSRGGLPVTSSSSSCCFESSCRCDDRSSSSSSKRNTVVLFATKTARGSGSSSKKKKKKKTKKDIKQFSSTNSKKSPGGGSGGGGFGAVSVQHKEAAAEASAAQKHDKELMSRYKEEFLRSINDQQQEQQSSKSRRLIQVSSDPLIFTVDDFVDPIACSRVKSDGSGCFDLLYPERIADYLFRGQESELDGLLFTATTSQDHNQHRTHKSKRSKTTRGGKNKKVSKWTDDEDDDVDEENHYPYGLHMDTNNQCLFRHVTAILYLNDIPKECGGATVFPLARCLDTDPALEAAKQLLEDRIDHTNKAALQHSTLMESRHQSNYLDDVGQNTAIKIQPQAGRLLLFFSRKANGEQDPRSWHAGERIKDNHDGGTTVVVEKRILTLFKQVDYNYPSNERENENDSKQEEKDEKVAAVAEGLAEEEEDDDDIDNHHRRHQSMPWAQPGLAQSTLEEYLAPQIEEQQNWLKTRAQIPIELF